MIINPVIANTAIQQEEGVYTLNDDNSTSEQPPHPSPLPQNMAEREHETHNFNEDRPVIASRLVGAAIQSEENIYTLNDSNSVAASLNTNKNSANSKNVLFPLPAVKLSAQAITRALSMTCTLALALTVSITPSIADESTPEESTPEPSYTLTLTDTQSDTTITKLELDPTTGELVEKYYTVELNKTEYGTGDTTKTFGWEKNATNNLEFKENPTTPVGQTITVKHDTSLYRQTTSNGSDINGSFIEQKTNTYDSCGGAINYFNKTVQNITSNFISNQSYSTSSETKGGAIYYERGVIENLKGDFIGNYAYGKSGSSSGGAIYNYQGTIGDITGDFIGNYAYSTGSSVSGGAIFNYGSIGHIISNFVGNFSYASSAAYGGAIYNESNRTIENINGDFISNFAYSVNSIAYGGAVCNNYGIIENITGDFVGNYVLGLKNVYGGAIYNYSGTIGNISSSFIGNYAKTDSTSEYALGGAVWTNKDLTFSANGIDIEFTGNYTEDKRGKTPNAIWLETSASSHPTINLKAENGGTVTFNDQIDGGYWVNYYGKMQLQQGANYYYNLSLTGDKLSEIILNNKILHSKATSENITLTLGVPDVFETSDLTMNSGTLSFVNDLTQNQVMQSLNIAGDINLYVDADLAEETMDRLPENTVVADGKTITVDKINLLTDAEKAETRIPFAYDSFKESIVYSGAELSKDTQLTTAFSPIYKYSVSYNPEDGFFTFVRGGGASAGSVETFNPAVLPTPVSTQAGAYTTQMQTFNYAFQHSDNFMSVPDASRVSMRLRNKYALSPTDDATDVGTFSPLLTQHQHNGFWVKPYASFENIPLKNGPKVSNINYGTLIGYDSDIKELKHGIDRVITGYIGYNGASQRYSGVDTTQNGGILGTTVSFYKNKFFNATTISVGASQGSTSTMFGHEDYTMLLAGIGNKTGYNFEFKDGRFIIQPAMLLSYTFVNTFDYTNAAGVRIDSDPLHAIQLAPGIKFIANTKNGWQPYLGVNMVWNVLDKQKVMANDVRLPEMSIKPYVEYGVGVQKCFKNDNFTAFGQAMVHNGGRNGISLSAGLRFRVGKKK